MRTSYFTKVLLLGLCLVMLISISGVCASWLYAESPLGKTNGNVSFEMSLFKWEGSDVLPDDEEEGLAHAVLIDNLINGDNIGLNAPDSYLNEQINTRLTSWKGSRDTLGSMAITQGTALEELFNLDTENVTFLIHMKSDTLYYIFTTSLDLGESRNPTYAIGSTISPIYRTTVIKENGTWVATKTEEGSATSAYYEESQLNFMIHMSQIPSFEPDSWEATTN